MSAGGPNRVVAPETSRNASSSEIGSTSGVNDSRISRKRFEYARYASKSGGTNTASGHRRWARGEGTAAWRPRARASYEADITTPRGEGLPTTTGLPVSEGSFRTSTDA